MSDDLLNPNVLSQINQRVDGDRSQMIGEVYGGIIVYVSGGQAIINPPTTESPVAKASSSDIGANPYKGLMAFQESDSANFFGRSRDIQHLWEQFCDLQNKETRLLPIFGPSGSGKSSLVRAGLIPYLGYHPLPVKEKARVAILVPKTQPLEALATVLARIAENDLIPVKKTREFVEELKLKNKSGQYDGLQRIASALPEIDITPLIILVDQFEEVYSQCKDDSIRDAMIGNLLYAASDRSQYVSVILTMRSDFLNETQKNSTLNRLFSTQGFLVPTMDTQCLQEAIAEPAKQAKHPLDEATVKLLIEQTEGRGGALPLLQFALSQIWEGKRQGETPIATIERIGGVGGALAGEAQRIYEKFSPIEQQIARRVFLILVQQVKLGDTIKYTRHREMIANLVSSLGTAEQVKQVIGSFAAPKVRLITLSTQPDGETAEITHEALFRHWQLLRNWLENNQIFLNWRDRLRIIIKQWEINGCDREALLRGKPLIEAEDWLLKQKSDLSQTEKVYIQASVEDRTNWQKAYKARQRLGINLAISIAVLSVAALVAILFAWHQQQEAQKAQKAFLLGIEPPSQELLKKLPSLLEEADKLSSTRQEENIQLALAYYRKILTDTVSLNKTIQTTPTLFQNQDKQIIRVIAKKAEDGIVETIRQSRLPQLEVELNNKMFGKVNGDASMTDIENARSGALRTTYKILMSDFGAKADLNGNGTIDNAEEAERFPCETFKDIEHLWRKYTNKRCGWYGSIDKDSEPTCTELGKQTLVSSIFTPPISDIENSLDKCLGLTKPLSNPNRKSK
ncbi:ATP-binding protein [Phormidium tenue]|jgi:hypothetical protein|uniref:Novel STAND NTPase 1 domain-containing protein n=1 Tax=Phormidium tenue FACHB-1050 TaxID=2692857 RepID=A0ABR8CEW8_9CYAN|nr:ATP-binding protein [Phormidium tenue]MBD2318660.1 hypothetical protein [Phormidium tenue FACHB-1050]